MSTLKDDGFRFVLRGTEWKWVHPLEVRFDDIDCTDMEDDEFAAFVASQEVTA